MKLFHHNVLENVNKHLNDIKNHFSGQNTDQSYAAIVKSRSTINDIQETKHVVIIKPKDNCMKSNATERMAKNLIVNNCKIRVKNTKKISNGGIILECGSEEDCKIAIDTISKRTEDLIAKERTKREPNIVIYGINECVREEDIIKDIINNNNEIKHYFSARKITDISEEIKIKFKFRQRQKSDRNNWCLAISPDLFKIINNMRSVLIGWQSCKFREYFQLFVVLNVMNSVIKDMEMETCVKTK
jgi:hypothetical protein